jgi:hypothetical protein
MGEPLWQRVLLLVIDKLLLAVAAAILIGMHERRVELAQERLEKARHIADIAIDRPLELASALPGHFDEIIKYAAQIRLGETRPNAERFTDLEIAVHNDLEDARAFYWNDKELEGIEHAIVVAVDSVKARALITSTLRQEDLWLLNSARANCYRFHGAIIERGIKRVRERFDVAYERPPSSN